MATRAFNIIVRSLRSFQKSADYQGKADFHNVFNELDRLNDRLSEIATPKMQAASRQITARLSPSSDKNIERETKKEAAKAVILSIQSKFDNINNLIEEKTKGFFIKFDSTKYPLVSSAVQFYTDGANSDTIDMTVYSLAKQDINSQYQSTMRQYSNVVSGTTTVNSIAQKAHKAQSVNVVKLAFKMILSQICELKIIKKACSFFGIGCNKDQNTGLNWSDITNTRAESINLEDVTTLVSQAIYIINYVRGAALGHEDYIDAEWGASKEVFLIDSTLPSTYEIFTGNVQLAAGVLNDQQITSIGARSSFYSPEVNARLSMMSERNKDLDILLHSQFLTDLDRTLGRVIKIINGWYLDPHTYCCLVNVLGGINTAVPKWLKTIQFILDMGITLQELDIELNAKRVNNILTLLISSAFCSIINLLGSFVRGWISDAEANFMRSFLNSKSELIKCLPFDQLVMEFGNIFDEITLELEQLLREYSDGLAKFNIQFDLHAAGIERRYQLGLFKDLIEKFIVAWEAGYLCSNSEQGTRSSGAKYSPTTNISSTIEGMNLVSAALEQPLVTKTEIAYFMQHVLNMPEDVVRDTVQIYDSPETMQVCLGGFNTSDIENLSKQTKQFN